MLEYVINPRVDMYPFLIKDNFPVCGRITKIDKNLCTIKTKEGNTIVDIEDLTIPFVEDEGGNKVYLTIPWRLNLSPTDITKEVYWKVGEGKRSKGKAVRVLSTLTYYSPSSLTHKQYGSHTRDFETTLRIVDKMEQEFFEGETIGVRVISHQIL